MPGRAAGDCLGAVKERERESARQIAAEQSKNGTKYMQSAAKRHQIKAECSKTTPNQRRTQQNDPRSRHILAKRFQITIKGRAQHNDGLSLQNAHVLKNELMLLRMRSFSRD